MNRVKNWRTISFVFWIITAAVMLLTMPNMDDLVREKGKITLPGTAKSAEAEKIIKKMAGKGDGAHSLTAVFYSVNNERLTAGQKEEIASAIHDLKEKKQELGIQKMMTHLDNERAKEKLMSKDGSAILAQISVNRNKGNISEAADRVNTIIETAGVETYLTGSGLIANDFGQSTQEGIKKTEWIAVIFILLVLIIVFRSPVIPVISLLTVGISYAVSIGVIAQIVDHFNFPFSNFTQVFVVVVLFGIGTDYNILLYTRFKEELIRQEHVLHAVKETYRTAGRTVLYSGLAVLIGFTSLIFANFRLYQSASGVAIGVLILLLVLITLNPFFMVLLGKGMFYPLKTFKGHGESRIWGFLAGRSAARPLASILLVLGVTVPFILFQSSSLNFNDLWEVDDKYDSKQGIRIIENHFSPGFSSPAILVIQSDETLADPVKLQVLDELADKILKIDGVAEVSSPTRPYGDKIKELYIKKQADSLNQGLGSIHDGVGQVNQGLSSAEDRMDGRNDGLSNVQTLINGTADIKDGVGYLQEAMNKVTEGFSSGAAGAGELEAGLSEAKKNAGVIRGAISELESGYSQLKDGLSEYDAYFSALSGSIEEAKTGYEQIEELGKELVEGNPDLENDPSIKEILEIASAAQAPLNDFLDRLEVQLDEVRERHLAAMEAFSKANQSLAEVNAGLANLEKGVGRLQRGSEELKNGLNKGADGSKSIAGKTQALQAGLRDINGGQELLLDGLEELEGQMSELKGGLSESTSGLAGISEGLKNAQSYLNGLSESETSEKFYISEDALHGKAFQKGLDSYLSEDRKIAKMTVILAENPYSREAMPVIEELNQLLAAELKGTDLADATAAVGGISARNADLEQVTKTDFLRTAVIMLLGIGAVLLFITKSVPRTVCIAGSLVLAYFASLGIGEWLSAKLLVYDLMSWNVPFFSFIMIVALGVDYSIFLMMRFNELEGPPAEKIVEASRHIGGVVLSAALILGGTFAALIPSGVLTLMQVAITVIAGLILLSLFTLPILLPALMGLTEKFNKFKK